MNAAKSGRGFSLLEVLITTALFGMIAAGVFRYFGNMTGVVALSDKRSSAGAMLSQLLAQVQSGFSTRYQAVAGGASYQIAPSASFDNSGANPCGDLVISRSPALLVFTTVCVPGSSPITAQNFNAHKDLRCPSGTVAEVREQVYDHTPLPTSAIALSSYAAVPRQLRKYGNDTTGFSTALCFRNRCTGGVCSVVAEAGTVISAGAQGFLVTDEIFLSTNDGTSTNANGFQFLPPTSP